MTQETQRGLELVCFSFIVSLYVNKWTAVKSFSGKKALFISHLKYSSSKVSGEIHNLLGAVLKDLMTSPGQRIFCGHTARPVNHIVDVLYQNRNFN